MHGARHGFESIHNPTQIDNNRLTHILKQQHMVLKTQCVHTVSLMKQKTTIIINALTITTSGSDK